MIEGGATLWNVYVQLYKEYGVTIPGGSCASVGAGGHVCGGGYGLLSRLHGLTVDHLYGVEIVCVDPGRRARDHGDARLRRTTPSAMLLWANLGGGGGNFGIVTRYLLSRPARRSERGVHRQPCLELERHRLPGVRAARRELRRVPCREQRCSAARTPGCSPAAPDPAGRQLPADRADRPVRRATSRQLLEQFAGAVEDGIPSPSGQVAPVGFHGVAVAHDPDVRRLPWLYATQTLNGTGPNQRGKYKSAYMLEPFPRRAGRRRSGRL